MSVELVRATLVEFNALIEDGTETAGERYRAGIACRLAQAGAHQPQQLARDVIDAAGEVLDALHLQAAMLEGAVDADAMMAFEMSPRQRGRVGV